MKILFAASSFYEILLVILVIVLIFNNLLRRQVLNKINDKLTSKDEVNTSFEVDKKVVTSNTEVEYTDYEIINE